ncbi:MAG: hypothetical protein C6I05_07280, partial [Epsilonproteobacteria bacterium]|nr:hypothetical protein [Campylobacterota bacterium]
QESSSSSISEAELYCTQQGGEFLDGVCVGAGSSRPLPSQKEEPIKEEASTGERVAIPHVVALIQGKRYNIQGYWIQIGEGAFDWLYIGISEEGDQVNAFKLRGLDPESGEFLWDNYDAGKITIKVEERG